MIITKVSVGSHGSQRIISGWSARATEKVWEEQEEASNVNSWKALQNALASWLPHNERKLSHNNWNRCFHFANICQRNKGFTFQPILELLRHYDKSRIYMLKCIIYLEPLCQLCCKPPTQLFRMENITLISCKYVAHFIIITCQRVSDKIWKNYFQSHYHKDIITRQHGADFIYFRLLIILSLSSTYGRN